MRALRGRIERLRQGVAGNQPPGPTVVLLDPNPGRPPGLHRTGPPGSRVAVWVGDPAGLAGRVPPYALILGGEIDPDAFTPFRGDPA